MHKGLFHWLQSVIMSILRFSKVKFCLLSRKVASSIENVLSTSTDVMGANLKDATSEGPNSPFVLADESPRSMPASSLTRF